MITLEARLDDLAGLAIRRVGFRRRGRLRTWPILALASLVAACSDRIESHYPTLDAARQDGAISRGWLPDFVPETATEITELHDIDTNEGWGRYSDDDETLRTATARCTALPDAAIIVRAPGTGWWPSYLSGRVTRADLAGRGVSLHRCPGRRLTLVAIEKSQRIVYFWHD